uniref:Uncharacterized protein n=1 Tax=Rhizophora mucronata TaxID=61149 RepID=A0A2P2IYY5_RHIMU
MLASIKQIDRESDKLWKLKINRKKPKQDRS